LYLYPLNASIFAIIILFITIPENNQGNLEVLIPDDFIY